MLGTAMVAGIKVVPDKSKLLGGSTDKPLPGLARVVQVLKVALMSAPGVANWRALRLLV